MTPNRTSVYPQSGHHDPDSLDCWCKPRFDLMCSECAEAECSCGCWKCGGDGWVTVDRETAEATDEPVIIIHACNTCGQNTCTCEASP
jgi:hypothetical protein